MSNGVRPTYIVVDELFEMDGDGLREFIETNVKHSGGLTEEMLKKSYEPDPKPVKKPKKGKK